MLPWHELWSQQNHFQVLVLLLVSSVSLGILSDLSKPDSYYRANNRIYLGVFVVYMRRYLEGLANNKLLVKANYHSNWGRKGIKNNTTSYVPNKCYRGRVPFEFKEEKELMPRAPVFSEEFRP